MATKSNITARQGETLIKHYRKLHVVDPDAEELEYAITDLTDYTARMQVRKNYGTPVLLELTTENGRIELGGELGTVDLTVAASAMAAIPADTYKYDLELVSEGSDPEEPVVDAMLYGKFKVAAEVTVEEDE